MDKQQCLERITKTGIIAVIRADNPGQALKLAEAVYRGGIDCLEITMTVPGALEVIKNLAANYSDHQVLVGAGTVLDSETARAAIIAGAEYVVSPGLNRAVIELCNRYQKLSMPGAMTVSEIITAMEAGADVVKLFPGNVLGPGYVKALRGPLPQVKLIPTGGVNLDNAGEWLLSGCLAVGVGGELTAGAQKGDFGLVTVRAGEFIARVQAARQSVSK